MEGRRVEGGGGAGRREKINEGWRIRRARNVDRDEEREEEIGKEIKMAFFATCSVAYCGVRLTCNLPPCLAVTKCLCRPNRDCFTTM